LMASKPSEVDTPLVGSWISLVSSFSIYFSLG
jgi:hypothetical protein